MLRRGFNLRTKKRKKKELLVDREGRIPRKPQVGFKPAIIERNYYVLVHALLLF